MKVPNNHINQKRLLVAVWPEQKQTHRIKKPDGSHVDLFMGFKEWKLNGWEGNPTVGRAISTCDEIKAGDYLLTQHNAFENEAKEVPALEYLVDPGEKVFAIEKPLLWLGIRPDGEIYCVDRSIICKRIYKPIKVTPSGLVESVTREKYNSMVYVDKVPECITEVKPGDVIVVSKMADCELKYVWDNQHKSLIRVNFERDFLGAVVEGLEYEF
jgi:hypothetical protein